MPSEDARAVLQDILDNIELIAAFTADLDEEHFVADPKSIYAVVRALEIISEASRRLPDTLKLRHPAIDWRRLAGVGNVYRHDYDRVDPYLVWRTIEARIPELRRVVEGELRGSDEPGSIASSRGTAP